MKSIAILSDTHGRIDPALPRLLGQCDEIWHAGDFGTLAVSEALALLAPLRGVFGNIDGQEIRTIHPQDQLFELEGIKVFMTHIGGYPGRYEARVKAILEKEMPNLYICGHSHICKVVRDPKLNLLHINPGAAGTHGLHHVKTIIRLEIENGAIHNLRVIEMGKRGHI